MEIPSIVLIVIILSVVFYITSIYNRLVTLRNRYKNAFAQIEVQLKRRYDLIPNLVETAKGYLKHEKETLQGVIEARNQAVSGLAQAASQPGEANAMGALASAERHLGLAMGKLNIVVEAYPDLKGSANMVQLNEELTTTENRVAFARQAFNDGVTAYNSYKQSFTPVLFAAPFGHAKDAQLLEFADTEALQAVPKVSFK